MHHVILKIMKGDDKFRELAKSTLMCKNEVTVYRDIVPFFRKYLRDSNSTLFNPDEWWTPRVYFADYGIFPELGDSEETIVALENLKYSGYRMGPKIDLDEDHLRLMIKNIALYHSMSYALRIRADPKLEKLSGSLAPFSFLSPEGEELGSYKRLISVGIQRLVNLVDNNEKYQFDDEFVANVKKLKEKHMKTPMIVMEKFLKRDNVFSIILHGDYVRNNVLFKYDEAEGFDNPRGVKMYDFQETRYATPVIDIAFFMYMNTPSKLREKLWDSLLLYYHENLIESLTSLLKCDKSDERLKPYSLENFLEHFAQHAFYGVAICLHYVPWIACPEEECAQIAHWFETDMNGDEFFNITQVCGGVAVDRRITGIVKHASDRGYLSVL